MPPKKAVEEEVLGPWSLGRFSSNLKARTTRKNRPSKASKASIAPARPPPPRTDRARLSSLVAPFERSIARDASETSD